MYDIHTPNWAAIWSADTMYAVTTSRWTKSRSGKIGSWATNASIRTKAIPETAAAARIIHMMG